MFRNVEHPKNSRFRETPIKLSFEKQYIRIITVSGQEKIQRTIRYNDLTLIDGKGIIKFDDIFSFKSLPLKRKIQKFSKNISLYTQNNGDLWFKQSCALVLKSKYDVLEVIEKDIGGKNYNDEYTLLAFCFPKGKSNIDSQKENLITK